MESVSSVFWETNTREAHRNQEIGIPECMGSRWHAAINPPPRRTYQYNHVKGEESSLRWFLTTEGAFNSSSETWSSARSRSAITCHLERKTLCRFPFLISGGERRFKGPPLFVVLQYLGLTDMWGLCWVFCSRSLSSRRSSECTVKYETIIVSPALSNRSL